MRAIFIGIDGLDYKVLQAKRYRNFDNLQRCLKLGYSALCEPEIAFSPPSWMTIYTGVSEKKHGVVTAPFHPNAKKLRTKTFAELRYPCLWDYLNDAGYTCGLANMPMTWPAKRIDGWMLAGWPAPRLSYTPADLPVPNDDYLLDAASAISAVDRGTWAKGVEPQKVVDWIFESERRKLSLAKTLPKVDVLFLGFTLIDRIGDIGRRWFFEDGDIPKAKAGEFFRQSYAVMDELLGDIFDFFEADVWVVVSDHGHRNFAHKDTGVFAVWGRNIRHYKSKCTVFEVAPSFLDALGISLAGKPFQGASRVVNAEDESKILRQLTGLGYI